MNFIQTADWQDGAADVSKRIIKNLTDGQRVLWLISGGSIVTIAPQVMAAIPAELTDKLTIMLVDERYGSVGHPESNWQKLMAAGFDTKQAHVREVLQDGLSFDETIARYDQSATEAIAESDFIIGLLGIGEDGHIAGIMVGTEDNEDIQQSFIIGIVAPPFQRMTFGYDALRQLSAAYICAFGDAKLPALQKLQSEHVSRAEQPAQVLRRIPEVYIYNDQLGETRG